MRSATRLCFISHHRYPEICSRPTPPDSSPSISVLERIQEPMQSTRICTGRLPPELLVEIFRLATYNPVRDVDRLVSWTPFEGADAAKAREECENALRTKRALALVCRLFRTLSHELLLEDIWIRYGSDGLSEALEASRNKDTASGGLGLGKFVKRVSLSSVGFDGSGRSCGSIMTNTRRILASCPNIRIICRPAQGDVEKDEFVDGIPPLDELEFPFLERVEWHNTPNDTIFATAPTPSIFILSQTIRVLILGPDNFPFLTIDTVIDLPNLHTLSIQSIDTFGEPPRLCQVNLPSLRHLILRRPEATFNIFDGALTPYAPQIATLELTSDFRFLRQDFASTLLNYCRNVTDLYVPVFSTRAPHQNEVPRVILDFQSVKRVWLYAGLPDGYVYGEQAWWTMLEAHFDGLCGENSRFVGLEKVVLSGREWVESVSDVERFGGCLRLAREKGVEVCADEQMVRRELKVRLNKVDNLN